MPTFTRVMEFDSETAEILADRTYDDNYRVKAVHKNTARSYETMRDGKMDLHGDERYSKFYGGRLLGFLSDNDVTDGEARMMLACVINCFKYGGEELSHRNNIPLSTNDLIQASGMALRSGYRALTGLIEKGILSRERDGRGFKYYINPFLVVCGAKTAPEAYERFKDTKWALVNASGQKSDNHAL